MISDTDKLKPPGTATVSGERLAQDEELDRSIRDLIVLVGNCENALRSTLQAQLSEKYTRTLQYAAKELVRITQSDE